MFVMELAGHPIGVRCRYGYLPDLCKEYLTQGAPEWVAEVGEEYIARENPEGKGYSPGYLESLAIYRQICERLVEEDIVLFHGSVLAFEGKGYLFAAPSGTGKSTHDRLWREAFGDRVTMINDDKPLFHISTGGVTVYGTPWGGKDNLQTNTWAPVAGILLLRQAPENTLSPLSPREAFPRLMAQTHRVAAPQGLMHTLELVQQLARLPVYDMGCTISTQAAQLACRTLTQKERLP